MRDISLIAMIGAAPMSGIVCAAYQDSRFGSLPVPYDTALPGGAADATATSGNAFGGPGQVVLAVPAYAGSYWVALASGGHISWVESPPPVVGATDSLVVHLAGTERITGGKTFTVNTTLLAGDGSNQGFGPELHLFGANGGWLLGIDSAAPISSRDFAISKFLVNRTVTDAATTSGSITVTSATAAFVSGDVGRTIRTNGLPAGTTITIINSATSVTVSNPATSTGSAQYAELSAPGVFDFIYATGQGAHAATLAIGGSNQDLSWRTVIFGPGDGVLDTAMGVLKLENGLNSTGDLINASTWLSGGSLFKVTYTGSTVVTSASANALLIQTLGLSKILGVDSTTQIVSTGGQLDVGEVLSFNGDRGAALDRIGAGELRARNNLSTLGTLKIGSRPGFSAGDKYLIVDSTGNVHVSALGPAS